MNPLSLRAENYRSFASLALDLPEGCVAIVGENGAGKSSVVNIIDVCLFGPETRSLADYLSDDATGDLLLEVEFDHAGESYRVRRGYSAKGRGKATLDFEHWEWGASSGKWDPLTMETMKETQARIEQTIGLSRETFRASAFLAQGDGAAFTEAQPRDRKRVLAEVLGLDVWGRLHEAVKAQGREEAVAADELRFLARDAEEVAAGEDLVRALVRDKGAMVDYWAKLLAEHREILEKMRAEQERDRVNAEKHERFLVIRDHAQREVDRLLRLGREALAEKEYIEAEEKALEELPTAEEIGVLIGLQEDFRALEAAKAEVARTTVGEWELDIMKPRDPSDPNYDLEVCPTCHQVLVDEARKHVEEKQAEAKKQRQIAEDRVVALKEKVGHAVPEAVEASLTAAREAETRRVALAERLKLAPQPVDRVDVEMAEKQLKLAQADYDALPPVVSIEDMQAVLDERGRMVAEAERQVEEARADKVRAEVDLERIEEAKKKLAELKPQIEAIEAKVEILVLLQRAFGPNGIPAMIVEQAAIPQIETEASRILDELGSAMRVELHSQRELKSSDGLADTLDVVVVSEGGAVRPYETFSGGERTRINLALRIALARLLARRRGAESRCLVVDEPEFLDEPGTQALAGVLQAMSGDFDRIYLVSHVSTLRDAFEQTIEVTKVDGRSRVTGAGSIHADDDRADRATAPGETPAAPVRLQVVES